MSAAVENAGHDIPSSYDSACCQHHLPRCGITHDPFYTLGPGRRGHSAGPRGASSPRQVSPNPCPKPLILEAYPTTLTLFKKITAIPAPTPTPAALTQAQRALGVPAEAPQPCGPLPLP